MAPEPIPGTDQNIDEMREVDSSQPIKNPPLRTIYQRESLYNPTAGAISLAGFGMGSEGSLHQLPEAHFYQLDRLNTTQELNDVTAFLLAFDTGTAPAVGRTYTVTHANKGSSGTIAEFILMEARAAVTPTADCDLVVRGKFGGKNRSYRYQPSGSLYLPDTQSTNSLTRAALLASLLPGDSVQLLGVLPGNGPRMGGDRDLDGIADGDTKPASLKIGNQPGSVFLEWPGPSGAWYPETSQGLNGPWVPMTAPSLFFPETEGSSWPTSESPRRFFRLRSTR